MQCSRRHSTDYMHWKCLRKLKHKTKLTTFHWYRFQIPRSREQTSYKRDKKKLYQKLIMIHEIMIAHKKSPSQSMNEELSIQRLFVCACGFIELHCEKMDDKNEIKSHIKWSSKWNLFIHTFSLLNKSERKNKKVPRMWMKKMIVKLSND